MSSATVPLAFPEIIPSDEYENMGDAQQRREGQARKMYRVNVALALIAGFGLLYQIGNGIFVSRQTGERFAKIETALRVLTQTTAPQIYNSIDDSLKSALADPTSSESHVEFARAAIKQLREASVSLPQNAFSKTGLQLSALSSSPLKDSPVLWKTNADFINYRSESAANWTDVHLPDCTDEPLRLAFKNLTMDGRVGTLTHGPIVFSNCKFVLDSPKAADLLGTGLSLADLIFTHCHIFYGGGPISIVLPANLSVGGSDPLHPLMTYSHPRKIVGHVIFQKCNFHFSLPSTPPPYGQSVVRDLLATNSDTIEVDVPETGV